MDGPVRGHGGGARAFGLVAIGRRQGHAAGQAHQQGPLQLVASREEAREGAVLRCRDHEDRIIGRAATWHHGRACGLLFCKLLWQLCADTSVTEAQQAVTRLPTDKSLRLWRPLFLFPTGKDITDAAAKGIEQRALDDRMLLQLTELTAKVAGFVDLAKRNVCLLYTSPSPRDRTRARMPSSA